MAKKLHYIKDGVEMETVFMDAGYHEQDWKEIKSGSNLIGDYYSVNGDLTVSFLKEGPSGQPELKIECENGLAITVVNEDTANEYLKMFEAKPKQDKAEKEE